VTFVHQDPDFDKLLGIVARETGIAEALVEKDYWVTHTLWALHRTGLDIWFKGGTSLLKGFRIIQRFSEDLDLMILPGTAAGLPEVKSWTSTNKGRVKQRQAYYEALEAVLVAPDVRIERDRTRLDPRARGADYLGYYPGTLLEELPAPMSPFVRLEVGRARVVPYVERRLSSFVHDYLEREGMMGEYEDNRPHAVRCVHPLVTLFEKLDAMARRYARDPVDPDSSVRHYEDAARIVRAIDQLPPMETTVSELALDMVAQRDIRALPSADEPALRLDDPGKRQAVERAYARIAPMFWGPRIPLDEACCEIREWLRQLETINQDTR
jgi:hypothetical protein